MSILDYHSNCPEYLPVAVGEVTLVYTTKSGTFCKPGATRTSSPSVTGWLCLLLAG